MREKTNIIICAMVCATLIVCGILFWPTLYRYDKTKEYRFGKMTDEMLVRINRITGYTEIFYPASGWHPTNESIKKVKLNASQLKSITGKAEIINGHFEVKIYNGSDLTIKKMKVNIVTKENDGSIRWNRSYDTVMKGLGEYFIPSQTTGSIFATLVDADNIASFDWNIEEAIGEKEQ